MSKQRSKNRERRLRKRIVTASAVLGLAEENRQLKNELKTLRIAYYKHLQITIGLKDALRRLGYIGLRDAEEAIEKAIKLNLQPVQPVKFYETEYREIDLE